MTIFVEIFKAWKKEISDGSSPVDPFGTVTSHGAIYLTLALCHSIKDSIFGLRTETLVFENIRAILFLMCGRRVYNF